MTGNDPDGTGKRTVRHYTKDYLLSFLPEWRDRYGFRCLYMDDDLFNTSDRHVLEICDALKQVGLPWSAMCRADRTRRETWAAMKDAGCFGVKVGMESGSQEVLDAIINKQLDLGEAVETLRHLKALGLTVHTTWTQGLPGETPEQVRQTHALIQRLYDEGLHQSHQLSGTAEIEGTPLEQIRLRGSLVKYPGAKADENYKPRVDGFAKAREMQGSP